MKFETVNEFVKRIKKSRSTLYRFYDKNEELKSKTTKEKRNRMIPIEHAKYFDSEIMFDENKELKSINKSMKNLIDCLADKDSLTNRLWHMEWSFFFTIAYKLERNKKSCFRQMYAMYEELMTKYGNETDIKIFFTTEPFNNRKGYHNHFMIHIENKSLHHQVINDIKTFFSYDRVDYGIYDKHLGGLFYMSKEGLVNEDWDILGNNLNK